LLKPSNLAENRQNPTEKLQNIAENPPFAPSQKTHVFFRKIAGCENAGGPNLRKKTLIANYHIMDSGAMGKDTAPAMKPETNNERILSLLCAALDLSLQNRRQQ
jgi:hypothetical protein